VMSGSGAVVFMKNKIFYYLPRVLIVLYLIFISLFALDEFNGNFGIGEIFGFFMHLVPSFVVLIVTIYAWKKEFFGGLALIVLGIIFAFYFHRMNSFIAACAPLIVIGFLFVVSGKHIKQSIK
jgi:hypothetical protein